MKRRQRLSRTEDKIIAEKSDYCLSSRPSVCQTVTVRLPMGRNFSGPKISPYELFLLKFADAYWDRSELDKKSNSLHKHVRLWLVFVTLINYIFSEIRGEAEERVDRRTSSLVKLKAEYGRLRDVDYQSLAEVRRVITFWKVLENLTSILIRRPR